VRVVQSLSHALIFSLILSSIGVSGGMAVPPGDVNSDGRVDVLDLQAVVADVLDRGAERTETDVNGDGCVDIRDFQSTFTQTEDPAEKEEAPSDEEVDPACHFANDSPVSPKRAVHSECVLSWDEDEDSPQEFESDRLLFRPPDNARYRYKLTPHAPPLST